MIAASFDGAIGRIYANGILLGTAPMQTPSPAAAPYLVGAYRSLVGPYYPWTGYQDAVALFPVALSDAQIAGTLLYRDQCNGVVIAGSTLGRAAFQRDGPTGV